MCESHTLIPTGEPEVSALRAAAARAARARGLFSPKPAGGALTSGAAELPDGVAPVAATVQTKESLEDILLAAFDAEGQAREGIVARLAVVLRLPPTATILATRQALAKLVNTGTLKTSDLALWLSTESPENKVAPAIISALDVLSKKTQESVKLAEVNALLLLLGIKAIKGDQNWRVAACGEMLVGKIYERLRALGYTKALPPLFASGLRKYLPSGGK